MDEKETKIIEIKGEEFPLVRTASNSGEIDSEEEELVKETIKKLSSKFGSVGLYVGNIRKENDKSSICYNFAKTNENNYRIITRPNHKTDRKSVLKAAAVTDLIRQIVYLSDLVGMDLSSFIDALTLACKASFACDTKEKREKFLKKVSQSKSNEELDKELQSFIDGSDEEENVSDKIDKKFEEDGGADADLKDALKHLMELGKNKDYTAIVTYGKVVKNDDNSVIDIQDMSVGVIGQMLLSEDKNLARQVFTSMLDNVRREIDHNLDERQW